MLELTTRFSGVTTGARPGRKRLSAKQAIGQGISHLRYIARKSAVLPGDTVTWNLGEGDAATLDEAQAEMRSAMRLRAKSGGARGVRVAEKMIFTLPNEFSGEPAREAVRMIVKKLANGSPSVKMYAVIHTDKPANLHVHVLAIDGLEGFEDAARRRTANTQRVRRRSTIRLGDRGRPKQLRQLFAECINTVARRRGLAGVEYRSFSERNVPRQPGRHRGFRGDWLRPSELLRSMTAPMFVPINELFRIDDARSDSQVEQIEAFEWLEHGLQPRGAPARARSLDRQR